MSKIIMDDDQLFQQEQNKHSIMKDISVIVALLLPFIVSIGILVFVV